MERRVKILQFSSGFLLSLLNFGKNPPQFFCLPKVEELPKDSYVQAVYSNTERDTIEALVHSEEFPVVPTGQLPEYIPKLFSECTVVELATREDLEEARSLIQEMLDEDEAAKGENVNCLSYDVISRAKKFLGLDA